ncbi:hypothetical protein [Paenibacillus lemnae]|uniref:Uncharacterized protein n=1 Tax=Paenibacillus lemnae TaxID=1330551 RepID=A0A848M3B0_PAELE|nr:hypothetical protein [Paenibacillus lemnae]NMO95417.1 hypothetical protein [Paenibacillus lemnae]
MEKDIGLSLGLLAGTTFGSGIGFLWNWQSYDLVWSVSIFGMLGMSAGLGYALWSRRSQKIS